MSNQYSTKRWVILPDVDDASVETLAEQLNIDSRLSKMLLQRGIENFEEAKRFFRPSLSELHDPFLMKDMDKAVARIEAALEEQENILIYGDYDVDGTTAVALMYSYFRNV